MDMAYKITYGPAGPVYAQKGRLIRKLLMKLVVAVLILGLRFTDIGEHIRSWLIPGDPAVTVAAWEGFTQDIVAGEGLADAVDAFCRSIVENGIHP